MSEALKPNFLSTLKPDNSNSGNPDDLINVVTNIWEQRHSKRITRKIFRGSNTSTQTQDFIKRAQSLFTSLYYLAEQNEIPQDQNLRDKWNQLENKVLEKIAAQWNIDEKFKQIHAEVQASNPKNSQEQEKELRYKCLEQLFKEYLAYIRHDILPKLIAYIPAETNKQALAKLVEAENVCNSLKIVRGEGDVLNQEEWAELDCEFKVNTQNEQSVTSHFSVLAPKGRVTHKQLDKIDADPKQCHLVKRDESGKKSRVINRSCYSRSGEGVASLSKSTCGYINDEGERVNKLEQYRHSSPVPYNEKDAVKRLAMTIRNAEQVVEVLADEYIAKELQGWGIGENDTKQQTRLADIFNKEETALCIPLTEIRLLSPIRKEFAFLDKQQRQYQQILESFIAFSSCDGVPFKTAISFPDGIDREIYVKPEINFFDFGVNRFRHEIYSDPLQDWINTRGFNDLCDQAFSKLNHDYYFTNELKFLFARLYGNKQFISLKQSVEQGRQQLKELYAELTDILDKYEASMEADKQQLLINYENKLIAITSFIENQHVKEANLLAFRKEWWKNNCNAINSETAKIRSTNVHSAIQFTDILQDFTDAQDLYYGKQYNTAANNYCLQKTLVRLNYKIGRTPLTGCNDNKDRAGNLANRNEADEIFYSRHNCYPRFDNAAHQQELKVIQAVVHRSSSSLYGTELYCAPGVRGYQLYAGDGNDHLDLENRFMAKLGKEIFHLPRKLRMQDTVKKIKQLVVNKVHNKTTDSLAVQPVKQQVEIIKYPQKKMNPVLAVISIIVMAFNLQKIAKIILSACLVIGLSPGWNLLAGENFNKGAQRKIELQGTDSANILKNLSNNRKEKEKQTDPSNTNKPVNDSLGLLNDRTKFKEEEKEEENELNDDNDEQQKDTIQVKEFLQGHKDYLQRKKLPENLVNQMSGADLPNTDAPDPRLLTQIVKQINISNTAKFG